MSLEMARAMIKPLWAIPSVLATPDMACGRGE